MWDGCWAGGVFSRRGSWIDRPRTEKPARMGVDGGRTGWTSRSLSLIPMSSLDFCLFASKMWGEGDSFGVPPSDSDLVFARGDLNSPGAGAPLPSSTTATESSSLSISDILEISSIFSRGRRSVMSNRVRLLGDDLRVAASFAQLFRSAAGAQRKCLKRMRRHIHWFRRVIKIHLILNMHHRLTVLRMLKTASCCKS